MACNEFSQGASDMRIVATNPATKEQTDKWRKETLVEWDKRLSRNRLLCTVQSEFERLLMEQANAK